MRKSCSNCRIEDFDAEPVKVCTRRCVVAKPIAVLISDVHYNIHTIELADAAMRIAINKANDLLVPLIVAGDLHDTKANLRGECIGAMIDTFNTCGMTPYVLVGNHDKINEKSEEHSLRFLEKQVNVVNYPVDFKDWTLIPYCADPQDAYYALKNGWNKAIMHQGLKTANSGEYIQDKSALYSQAGRLHGMRIISGHYHTRQTIALPNFGKWDYIGNPYSLGFGEANDPEKGFQILMDDGSLQFVPTKLRKHVVIEIDANYDVKNKVELPRLNDLVWIKCTDTKENLARIDRAKLQKWLMMDSFRLTYHPLETTSQVFKSKNLTQPEILDNIINNLTNTSDERKARLKELWRKLEV